MKWKPTAIQISRGSVWFSRGAEQMIGKMVKDSWNKMPIEKKEALIKPFLSNNTEGKK